MQVAQEISSKMIFMCYLNPTLRTCIILCLTPITAPSIAPGNVEVNRLNGTAMNVSWVPLNLVEARGFVQSYIITYQQASSGSRRKRQMQTQQVDGRASSAVVGGLQPGVAYEVSIAAMTTETGPGELD